MPDQQPDRREFLASVGLLPLLGSAGLAVGGDDLKLMPDAARALQPSAADLGTNFAAVEQIAATCQPSVFPIGKQIEFNEIFRTAARAKVREVLSYEPPRVDFQPEVVERVDCGEFWRERVLISTTPWFRIPAYVLIPKDLKKPAPAIVDLHSHGGMFLFGKEKVIDFGTNHPAMIKYHQQNYDGRPTATALVRRGYVVISIDAFMFGERRVLLDEDLKFGWDRSKYSLDDVQQLNQKCRAKEATIAKSLVFAGATWPGVVNYDDPFGSVDRRTLSPTLCEGGSLELLTDCPVSDLDTPSRTEETNATARELSTFSQAWPHLPSQLRATILQMVQASNSSGLDVSHADTVALLAAQLPNAGSEVQQLHQPTTGNAESDQ